MTITNSCLLYVAYAGALWRRLFTLFWHNSPRLQEGHTMTLTKVRVEHADQISGLIGAAIRMAAAGDKPWIIVADNDTDRWLCLELEGGEIEAPPVDGVFGFADEG